MSRGRRAPTAEEIRLWAEVARTVEPLGERPPPAAEPATPPRETPTGEAQRPARPPATPRRAAAPAPAAIDRRTQSRLGRGILTIDARLDLHGLTQAAAHGRLLRFLKEAQGDGARLALIITGKGRPAEPFGAERGVLRRAVPEWLATAEMRPFVAGFGEASPAHGGAGALYVRIRRPRP
jgi:DNA-nicking Smr family endonuclease